MAFFVRGLFGLALLISPLAVSAQETGAVGDQADPKASATAHWEPDGSRGWWTHRANRLGTGASPSKTDALRGQTKWRFLAESRITQTPVTYDNVLFIGDWGGIFYAIDAKKGTKIWQTKLPPIDANKPQKFFMSNPCIVADTVVASTQQGLLTAFSRKDGSIVWQKKMAAEMFSSPRYYKGRIVFGCIDRSFYCLDAKTGDEIWSHVTGNIIGSTGIITKSGNVIFPAHDKHVYTIDIMSGKVKNRHELGYRSTASPVLALGALYMPMTGNKFGCYDLFSGTIRWTQLASSQHQHGVGYWKGPKGAQVMVHMVKYLMCYDALKGHQIWRYQTEGKGAHSPAIGPKLVYLSDDQGFVHAVELESGRRQWIAKMGSKSGSSPILDSGVLYVADESGVIYAIE